MIKELNIHFPTQNSNSFQWTYLDGSDLKSSLDYPNGLTASWTYDANNQLSQVCNATPTNVISQYDYTYDVAGRRVQIARSGSAMSENRVDEYGYNIRNELISAVKCGVASSLTTEYAYQYDDIGNRIRSLDLGTNRTYTTNNLNQYTSISNSAASALSNPFRFSSEYSDDALGFVYYNYRHLEPVTGRWLQRDMIEEEGGVALYGICLNRIIESVDYLGRLSCCRCTYIGNMLSPGQSTGFSYQGGQHCFYLSEGSIIEVNLELACESRFWGFGACDNKKCLVRTRYRCQKFQSVYFWVYLTDRVFPCSEK